MLSRQFLEIRLPDVAKWLKRRHQNRMLSNTCHFPDLFDFLDAPIISEHDEIAP